MILIVTAVFPPEPIVSANLSYDIATELSNGNEYVKVVSPRPSRPFGHSFDQVVGKNLPFDHQVVNSYVNPKSKLIGRLRESISFGKASKKVISENSKKINVIYMNSWPLFAQYYVIKEAKKNSIPVVLHIQDIYPESLTKKLPYLLSNIAFALLVNIDKYIVTNAHKIITISPNMKSYLTKKRFLDSQKIEVIRNWQNDESFISYVPTKIKKSTDFIFMYVGSISASAGVDYIINSFNRIKNNSNIKLVIAGSGSDKEKCIKLAAKNKAIEFWNAPYSKIPEIQSKADLLVLSLKKGIGLTASPSKFTAYLFSKKPVIASLDDESDTAHSIKESNCGFVVRPEDELELTKTMEKVVKMNREQLNTMGENGYKYALKNLSRQQNLKKVTDLISSLQKN